MSVAITMSVVNRSYNSILNDLPEKINRYSVLDELDAVINSNFYGSVAAEGIDAALAGGYIDGLGDPYSVYMTADEYEKYQSETQGSMAGIGIEFSKRSDGYINIDSVYSGSPAQTGGLKSDDIIVAFDGEVVTLENYDDMVSKLIGDKLTTVNLTYRRDGVEKTISVVKGYEAKSVVYSNFDDIGYIRISNFYSTTAKQVEDAVDKLTGMEVEGIVLDVRDNSSTNFSQALNTLDIFIPIADGSGGIATIVNTDNEIIKTYTSTSGTVNIPVVVLVNSRTSGCAEFLACELRDFDMAELVGTKTKGMGLVQEIFQLTDGSAVRLSVGKIVPYRSESYHDIGVVPDHEVESTTNTKVITEDNQYLYAASLLMPESTEE